jgi:hypothetical protein
VFCAAAGTLLGRYDLHTDDTGVEVFAILTMTFILGCWRPQHAWQWALLVGPCAPAAELIFLPGPKAFGQYAAIFAVVIAIGMAGAYIGALTRKAIAAGRGAV